MKNVKQTMFSFIDALCILGLILGVVSGAFFIFHTFVEWLLGK